MKQVQQKARKLWDAQKHYTFGLGIFASFAGLMYKLNPV